MRFTKGQSCFQRQGETYPKERSVIFRQDDVGGRARVTSASAASTLNRHEVMKVRRLNGCENFVDE